jgi:hypothetical protein
VTRPTVARLRDIPQLIPGGSYNVNVPWHSLERFLAGWIEQGLDIDPEFQRGHVWDEAKQIAYVEFVLRGGRSSRTILFNNPNWHITQVPDEDEHFVLVDGKQRLEAVRRFVGNQLPAFGRLLMEYADELPPMCGPDFVFSMNTLRTKAEVLEWYLQLNSGGVVHTEAELKRVRKLLECEQKAGE